MLKHSLVINREVRDAIADNRAVVALESTIISHGMPYPQNVETARLLEQTVRDNGGVPATIAILNGKIHVGLAEDELEFLATDKNIAKASRRDLPALLAGGRHAATTVAATMICSVLAGVRFFATGGIGGVHRGAAESMDVSADLREFAETPVLVVSAGAKAILDIPLTMEYLETMGVPVLGYCTDEMPAFYYARSGVKVPVRVDSAGEAAAIFKTSLAMGYRSGILVGNPIPEADALDRDKIEACIAQAVSDADLHGVKGQQVTPFLLGRLNEITGGDSLKTNISLVRNNAAVCTKIAVEFFK
ncbi:MAG: pseudouridine-5-phosphate glycosidase [Candidatus Riflebacteria bacterium HGW-Riflebacteria-1]|jgi:pseudouridine-5'-phosphate glycosidase|nr:MAG: pseudouridine-5-phosphate glycosidase [Candidatus Riflebacteria bacterium HGW-Riflebacteria-1]